MNPVVEFEFDSYGLATADSCSCFLLARKRWRVRERAGKRVGRVGTDCHPTPRQTHRRALP